MGTSLAMLIAANSICARSASLAGLRMPSSLTMLGAAIFVATSWISGATPASMKYLPLSAGFFFWSCIHLLEHWMLCAPLASSAMRSVGDSGTVVATGVAAAG